MSPLLLSATYLGTVEEFALLAANGAAKVEFYDHYSRQTLRNRAWVLSSDGKADLVIPVVKPKEKTLGKDIVIANNDWQPIHWRTIKSSYDSSPFLEFYEDELAPFFHKPYKFLYDLDFELMSCIARLMGLKTEIVPTEDYVFAPDNDYRQLVLKKGRGENVKTVPYYQVFSRKFGFVPGLSALDLLCNMGPESIFVLKESVSL